MILPESRSAWGIRFGAFLGGFLNDLVNGSQPDNLELPGAVGNLELNGFPYFLTQQRAANRRSGGNTTVGHVGFLAGYQLVNHLFILVEIDHCNRGAKSYPVARNPGEIDHGQLAQSSPELAQ